MRSTAMCILVPLVLVLSQILPAADFDGDGTEDLAVFRARLGLWAVRGVTRLYFGGSADEPVAGDYDGNGTASAAIFRPSTGLWAVRGVTRVYFGNVTDEPKPGDYNGDGADNIGIFRGSIGLWAVRGVTRVYFGSFGDIAVPGKLCRLSVTGQTFSKQTGDDGDLQAGAAFNFQTVSIGGDLVTIDHNTGLMWAADGNGEGCWNGGTWTWSNMVNVCNNLVFAGYSDWRMPNRREFESLVNAGTAPPTINSAYFPNTASDEYWTSTVYQNGPYIWYIDFSTGIVNYQQYVSSARVRAVRGPC